MSTPQTTAAADWGTAREMSAFEAMMWRAEADPRLRSTVAALEILDAAPDWERLVAAHDWGTRLVPRFRQRVVEPPLGLGAPAWVVDPDFDLHYHLKRVRLPEPGTFRQLLDLAQSFSSVPFDRARAPWEAVLIEGLEDGRAGYLLKLHHSATDGLGGIQLLGLLHSRRREHTPDKPQTPPPAPESGSSAGVFAGQLARGLRAAPGDAVRRTAGALGLAGRVLSRPDRAAADAVHFGRSLGRVLTPPPGEPSPLLRGRSMSWRFETHAVALADLKAAAKAGGGSLNDAFISALLGAFRLYHEQLGTPIETMPIAIPISLRTGDHPMGGNRFAGARFAAPVGEPDPRERMQLVREFVLEARDEPAIDALSVLAPAMSHLPGPVLARMTAGFTATNDLQASNVPGIGHAVYLAGARITHMYPFGPLPGCAAMIALVSHDGTCCIGANLDAAAVTEPDRFAECLRAGFDEVLALR